MLAQQNVRADALALSASQKSISVATTCETEILRLDTRPSLPVLAARCSAYRVPATPHEYRLQNTVASLGKVMHKNSLQRTQDMHKQLSNLIILSDLLHHLVHHFHIKLHHFMIQFLSEVSDSEQTKRAALDRPELL